MTLPKIALLSLATVLGLPLTAQEEEARSSPPVQDPESVLVEGGDKSDKSYEGKEIEAPPGPGAGLRNHLSIVPAFRPRRLSPGGSGTMQLILAMRGGAVLTPGSHFQVTLPARYGALEFGAWTLQEPGIGRLETAFRGQPVYENTAIVEVPVQVVADAEYGQQRFSLRIEAEVTDGTTGNVVGTFYDAVNGMVEIGDPLPSPIVRAAAGAGASTGSNGEAAGPATVAGPADLGAEPAMPTSGEGPIDGVVAPAGSASGAADPGSAGSAAPRLPEQEGVPLFLIAGVGVLLVLVVLLLVFRGR